MNQIEVVARWLCEFDGFKPDVRGQQTSDGGVLHRRQNSTTGKHGWENYVESAEAFIKLINDTNPKTSVQEGFNRSTANG